MEGQLKWWQLSLLGVGCTIGTGYFLGSGLAMMMAGPSAIFVFILAALGTYIVYDALAKMTIEDPQQGSFRSYAKKAYGRWAGFSSGWVYWLSEMMIMGSQMTALAIFSRFWFPNIPLWVFAAGYAVLGILVVLMGTKGFDRIENLLAVVKIAAILMFIIIAILALIGVLKGAGATHYPHSIQTLFPKGPLGLWSSFIYAFYAFGGIEIMGIMAMQLKNKDDAPKAGKLMLFMLGIIYVISICLAVIIGAWQTFNTKESPFVIALKEYHLTFFPHVFNGALIVAGFSTMVASLFSVTTMLVTLAKDGDAPHFFSKKAKKEGRVPLRGLGLTLCGMIVSVVLALLMPGKIYEYITTAAGLMLLYNWLFILLSSFKLSDLGRWGKSKNSLGILLILLAVSGTLFHAGSRPGFYGSIVFILIIGIVVFFMHFLWKKRKVTSP
ncbi:L-asparagine transporter-like permease [Pullulanibacillus pueri]|uniref:Putative transporter YcgH n=1 Tax=Pullulanibacillus pueri TaxID=1437324 RepID=A0A8J3EKS0_9BACL|nr:amino acid permease [Pullulanibacillus pueri]MBM7680025.1 L-asparagine transporter-like permease [Pullulanibacillus pueri]GGH73994.1 putative transporter YcgH [Pullulanibacillus pueri]